MKEDDVDKYLSGEARVARYLMRRINGGPIDPELEALDRELWINKYAPRAAVLAEQITDEVLTPLADEMDLEEIAEYTPISEEGRSRDEKKRLIGELERIKGAVKRIQTSDSKGRKKGWPPATIEG